MPHTPGPWVTDDDHYSPPEGFAVNSDAPGYFDTVCRVYSKANAVLIAAAPDLLTACRAAQMFIRNGVEMGYIRLPTVPTDPALRTPAIIEGAIAKAEGRNA